MPRQVRRPLASSATDIDRQAIEQRARQAAMPAPIEEKGHWPFPVKDVEKDALPQDSDKTCAEHDAAGDSETSP